MCKKRNQERKRKPKKELVQVKYSRMPTVLVKKSSVRETKYNDTRFFDESIEIIRQLVLIFGIFSIKWFLGFFIFISINTKIAYTVNSFIISLTISILNIFSSFLNLYICLLLNNYSYVSNKLEKIIFKLKMNKLFKRCNKKKISEAQTNDNQVIMTSFNFKSDSFISKIELNNFL